MTAPMWVGGQWNNYENHLIPDWTRLDWPMQTVECAIPNNVAPGTVNWAERAGFYSIRYDTIRSRCGCVGAGQWTELRRLVPV